MKDSKAKHYLATAPQPGQDLAGWYERKRWDLVCAGCSGWVADVIIELLQRIEELELKAAMVSE